MGTFYTGRHTHKHKQMETNRVKQVHLSHKHTASMYTGRKCSYHCSAAWRKPHTTLHRTHHRQATSDGHSRRTTMHRYQIRVLIIIPAASLYIYVVRQLAAAVTATN